MKGGWFPDMTQWVCAAKSDDLSSHSKSHTVEEENCPLKAVLWLSHACGGMQTPIHRCTHDKQIKC